MYFGGSHQIKDLDELQTLLPVLNIDKLIIDKNTDSLLWVPTQDKRQISDMETRWMDIRDKRQETDMEGERMGLICQIEGYLVVYPPVHPGSIGWELVLSFKLTQRRKPLIESTILWVLHSLLSPIIDMNIGKPVSLCFVHQHYDVPYPGAGDRRWSWTMVRSEVCNSWCYC